MDFVKLFAEVAGLSTFIFSGVSQLKQFGVEGKALTFSAYGFGLVVGGLYRYFVYTPASALDWFWLALFGMAGGFIATGVYKGMEESSGKAMYQREAKADAEAMLDCDCASLDD